MKSKARMYNTSSVRRMCGTGHHVYFLGDFVCSYRLGWGCPAEFRLADAVQTSAAFPGRFSPRWLATKHHSFMDGATERPIATEQ